MDEFERRLGDLLTAPFKDEEPPASLQGRIMRSAAAARHRRVAAGGVVVAAVAGLGPVAVMQAAPERSPADDPATVTATDLGAVVERGTIVRIPRDLPGRSPFEAMAVNKDGTVLGAPQAGADGNDARSTGIWRAGPAGGRPALVTETAPGTRAYLWAMAAGDAGYLWPDGERLACRGPAGAGPSRTLDAAWGGRDRFFADGPAFVWGRNADALRVATACGGETRTYPVGGTLEGFSFPYAIVRTGAGLRQVDVRDGAARDLVRLAASADPVLAASPRLIAWADGGALRVLDRGTGTSRQAVRALPHAADPAYAGRLTAGDRVVAYTAAHQDEDVAESVVLDVRTGREVRLHGEVRAAGGWLLWREGADYRLARVRS
ncbi:hypothetical protein E1264_02940 [Actinomadura sp. KC216]|uniref:hypothetical protein n=1 Tax=Actinomadura sp. KC216 TaxID=2530370 RepID=UPI00105220A4|nr:hypothetical protein [Actinomadura sp. KC216]TDB91110.1 hypothetical protein E1264_02940 [Actinomadura sp. KC216]